MGKLVVGVLAAAGLVILARLMPDIRRYVHIKRM
jgi:hypothetical protein